MPRSRTVLAVVLALAAPAVAQQPPSGDLLRRTADVAARQVEAETKFALREIQRFANTDRTRALARLDKLLTTLESDRALSAERRDQLIRVVKDRARVVKAAPEPTPEVA